MKKILTLLFALPVAALAATLSPIQLLNPAGSAAGQAIVSTGASTAPGWATVVAGSLAPVAANTAIANTTGSSASPTAVALPSCSATGSALLYTTSTGFGCATGYAPLASPTFTGTPGAPTAAAGTSTTQIATTAFLTQPGPIGSATANTGRFTTLQATGALTPSSTAGIVGTTAGDNANAGSIGELLLGTSSGGSLTTGTPANATSVGLTAGDWDVQGTVLFIPAGTTTMSSLTVNVNTVSATINNTLGSGNSLSTTFSTGQSQIMATPVFRISVASGTTVYLVTQASFGVSTMTVNGSIRARRAR